MERTDSLARHSPRTISAFLPDTPCLHVCVPLGLSSPSYPDPSQNNRMLVKTSNQIKWMGAVWLRISVSVGYRPRSDIGYRIYNLDTIPVMVKRLHLGSLVKPMRYPETWNTFGLLVDSFFIHLTFATVYTYVHTSRYFIHFFFVLSFFFCFPYIIFSVV